jgi:hypothetical protein
MIHQALPAYLPATLPKKEPQRQQSWLKQFFWRGKKLEEPEPEEEFEEIPFHCDSCYERFTDIEKTYYHLFLDQSLHGKPNPKPMLRTLNAPPARGVNQTLVAVQLGHAPEAVKALHRAQKDSLRKERREQKAAATIECFDRWIQAQRDIRTIADFWSNFHQQDGHNGSQFGPLKCAKCNVEAGRMLKPATQPFKRHLVSQITETDTDTSARSRSRSPNSSLEDRGNKERALSSIKKLTSNQAQEQQDVFDRKQKQYTYPLHERCAGCDSARNRGELSDHPHMKTEEFPLYSESQIGYKFVIERGHLATLVEDPQIEGESSTKAQEEGKFGNDDEGAPVSH